MVKYYPSIPADLQAWALTQPLFFIASAPLLGRHVNISPKGMPTSSFRILSPNQCAYLDATGSGNETISHLAENGRATVMFCSFDTSPRILRLFCRGRVVEWHDQPEIGRWLQRITGDGAGKLITATNQREIVAMRAVIVLEVWKVQTSCGFAVPRLAVRRARAAASSSGGEEEEEEKQKKKGEKKIDEEGMMTSTPPAFESIIYTARGYGDDDFEAYFHDRPTLGNWAVKQVEGGTLRDYQRINNHGSLDGLPGLRVARQDQGEWLWWGDARVAIRRAVLMGLMGGIDEKAAAWPADGLLLVMGAVALLSSLLTLVALWAMGWVVVVKLPEGW